MTTFEVWIIIILVVGVVFSNLAVLKYSAKFKLPPFKSPSNLKKNKKDPKSKLGGFDQP
ncbi:DUF2897 family protein [Parashewanella spongiae]|uniref:DUF2897 family protein n=1 Tax=Parashewanella spongiae TaxID=342950 RepID=A0A3A6T7A0_9GAMM|nr:DUF2897 family protein [Parashewanella spongiae]RJY07385.1 DUF2897 family protein [Parashewanella spongiae]